MDKLYTIQEVATKLNLSDKTLRRWEEAGRFTSSRTLGNQRRYSIEDLQILDAIKHGTITDQKDLLTIDQAGKLCGVSPTTILRWEDTGKIHPFITSGNTYYPRQKLIEKMAELKKIYVEPEPTPTAKLKSSEPCEASVRNFGNNASAEGQIPKDEPVPQGTVLKKNPWRGSVEGSLASERTVPSGIVQQIITNALVTLILILSYHLLFNQSKVPTSPQGSVQGAATITTSDPRIDDLIIKLNEHLSSELLKDAKPTPTSNTKLDNASLVTGTMILPKNKNQISVTADKITSTTPVTVTFTSDFAPAKKYWVTPEEGSFTVNTDFPVSTDSTFNYSFIASNSAVLTNQIK